MELINLKSMSHQNISFFAFIVSDYVSLVHLLVKFYDLRFNNWISSMRVNWFGNNTACNFSCRLIWCLVRDINLTIRLFIRLLINLPCQYIWNLLSFDIINIASLSQIISINLIIILRLREPITGPTSIPIIWEFIR